MAKILMLNIKNKSTPFAYSVPDQTYELFKHYQDVEIDQPTNLLASIEAHADSVIKELFDSINEWKTKCKNEIAAFDRHEKAKKLAGNLFT